MLLNKIQFFDILNSSFNLKKYRNVIYYLICLFLLIELSFASINQKNCKFD